MNRKFASLILLCASAFALISYKKKLESNSTFPIDLSVYSGVWKGRMTMVKTGSCAVVGPPNYTTTQRWTVDKNGNVSIFDTTKNRNTTVPFTWSGKIDSGGKIAISTIQQVSCSGAPATSSTVTIHLNGNLVSNATGVTLNTIVDYPICPPTCLFNLHYSLKKQQNESMPNPHR